MQESCFNEIKCGVREAGGGSRRRTLSSLNSAYVIRVFGAFVEDRCMNVVMEFASGGTLHDFAKVWTMSSCLLTCLRGSSERVCTSRSAWCGRCCWSCARGCRTCTPLGLSTVT